MSVIIYPPTIDWEYMRQRPQQLMLQFAKNGHRVFYCNKKQLCHPCLEKVAENLWVVHNVDLFLAKHIPKIKAGRAPVIVWCSWSMLARTLKGFQPDVIIYDCLDEFVDWLPYEPAMVNLADLVFCSSDHLYQRLSSHYRYKKIFLLKNGSDFAHFNYRSGQSKKRPPADLPPAAGARIGYIGAWAWWVDVELVEKICRSYPEYQIVVIGPNLGARLPREFPNFKYLGLKDYEKLPDYLAYLDLCLIPFKINRTTIATNPIKVYEYLAAGKPVISTALPEVIIMQPLVKIGNDHEQFLQAIPAGLAQKDDNLSERMDFAWTNSWGNRFTLLEEVLQKEVAGFHDDPGKDDKEEHAPSAAQDFRCLYPVADATVRSLHPGVNFDSDPILIGRRQKNRHRCLLKFDLRGLTGAVKKATLAIFVDKLDYPEKLKCLEVRKILQDWDEKLVSWETMPASSPLPVRNVLTRNAVGWLEWDLTPLAREWIAQPETNFGVLLKGHKKGMPFLVRAINRHQASFYSPKLKIYF